MKELRLRTGMSQKKFAQFLDIPIRTIQCWEQGTRTPPDYVVHLIYYYLRKECGI